MTKTIAILGSTGSIGITLLNIIKKNKNFFNIVLLTANKDYKTLFSQAKKYGVKNLIITDKKIFLKIKNNKISKGFNISNNFENLEKVFKNKKIDYVMSSIIGIDGLYPTIEIIKHTKKIAIANKEAIICGWSLIKKELFKYKTIFIPVDSEHFSLWFGMKGIAKNISKIYLTASGGPFFKKDKESLKNVSISSALNHPNWRMGKKITIDSSTMMNKIFVIKIFF